MKKPKTEDVEHQTMDANTFHVNEPPRDFLEMLEKTREVLKEVRSKQLDVESARGSKGDTPHCSQPRDYATQESPEQPAVSISVKCGIVALVSLSFGAIIGVATTYLFRL